MLEIEYIEDYVFFLISSIYGYFLYILSWTRIDFKKYFVYRGG
jgi:hypothetical protein